MAKKIPLTQGQAAIVDDDDFEFVNQWKWCARFLKTNNNRNNKAGFKGIFWCEIPKKWRVQIYINSRSASLGYFSDKIEAARAYDRAAIQHHGEFARLNFPREEYVNG